MTLKDRISITEYLSLMEAFALRDFEEVRAFCLRHENKLPDVYKNRNNFMLNREHPLIDNDKVDAAI